ncbi:MAG: hypothetical protein QXY40_05815 [Candidatus Methanomethylicia archaeon]
MGVNYVLVGGLTCILMGVRRITEDADFIVNVGSESEAEKLYEALKNGGFNVSIKDVIYAFKNKNHFTILINSYRLDFKFPSSTLDFETLRRAIEIRLEDSVIRIARLEENIAAKIIVLASMKDLEDALWLMIHHRDKIDWHRLSKLLGDQPSKIISNIILKIEDEFKGNSIILEKLSKLKTLLKDLVEMKH